jgi:hypothetical protein
VAAYNSCFPALVSIVLNVINEGGGFYCVNTSLSSGCNESTWRQCYKTYFFIVVDKLECLSVISLSSLLQHWRVKQGASPFCKERHLALTTYSRKAYKAFQGRIPLHIFAECQWQEKRDMLLKPGSPGCHNPLGCSSIWRAEIGSRRCLTTKSPVWQGMLALLTLCRLIFGFYIISTKWSHSHDSMNCLLKVY